MQNVCNAHAVATRQSIINKAKQGLCPNLLCSLKFACQKILSCVIVCVNMQTARNTATVCGKGMSLSAASMHVLIL